MFCPRCGAESDEGSRYCASCGAELPRRADPADRETGRGPTPGERLKGLPGGTRRSRMLTLGTALALLVAAIGFIVLDPAEDESEASPDAYARSLDQLCVERKREVAAAQRQAVSGGSLGAVSRYADSLVPIVGEWRIELAKPAPAGRQEDVNALRAALLEVEIEAGTLARVAREADREGVARTAPRVDAATENVEIAAASLGLERCTRF